MLFTLAVYSQSCDTNKDICLTPTTTGASTSIDITFSALDGYVAFGYGGESMSNSNMVVITKGANGYVADSYFSSGFSTPKIVTNVWTVSSSGTNKLTIKGSDPKFKAGSFIYAKGKVTGGQIQKHTTVFGSFDVTMGAGTDKYATASVVPVTPPKASPIAAPKQRKCLIRKSDVTTTPAYATGSTGSTGSTTGTPSPDIQKLLTMIKPFLKSTQLSEQQLMDLIKSFISTNGSALDYAKLIEMVLKLQK